MDKKHAALPAPLVALLSGSWAALKSCAAEAPADDAGSVVVDSGPVDPPPPPPPPPQGSTPWVSAYYAGWFPDMLPADRIDFSAMTHLIVGRAAPLASAQVVQMLDSEDARGRARALELCQLAHLAERKCVLMLGGVGDGPAFRAASSESIRGVFVANILSFMDAMRADGVDLDWEEEIDYGAFLALARELRAARPGIILTVPVFPVNINWGLDAPVAAFVAAVHPVVDQINVMSYGIGMAGPWGGWQTWHTGALFGEGPTHPTSVSSTLAAYHAAGVPKAKLGMGIGFGGIDYRYNTGPLQALVDGPNPFGADDVEYRYSRVAAYLAGRPEARQWDDVAKMSYLSFPGGYSPGAGFSRAGFLSYEDERSIAAKGAWLKAEGYGGAIVWVVNYDTLPATGTGPLNSAVKAAFLE